MFFRTRHSPFPRIDNPAVTRLPRGASYTDERDAGRCLIALRFAPRRPRSRKRFAPRIAVRNCYVRGESDIVVENSRELLHSTAHFHQGVKLEKLTKDGTVEVYRGPFMVIDPMPNCIVEMKPRKFDALWETHRFTRASESSPRISAASDSPLRRLFELHWKAHGLGKPWQGVRVNRICRMWGLTPFELAEMIQWPCGRMEHFLKMAETSKDGWPLPGPVALWFYFLENFKLGISVFPTVPERKKES